MDDPSRTGRLVRFSEERVLPAPVQKVWSLWTTRDGLESWWSPEAFVMKVEELDVRVGGRIEFTYEEAGSVSTPEWQSQFQGKGLSTSWSGRGTFLEVDRLRRLSFRQALDFGPKSSPQDDRMAADFRAVETGTRLILTAEAPSSKHWMLLGRPNLVGQLDRLARVLALPTPS